VWARCPPAQIAGTAAALTFAKSTHQRNRFRRGDHQRLPECAGHFRQSFHHQAGIVDRGNSPGPVPNFNKFASYSWTIATSSGGVQNFATNEFILDTSSFSNDFSGGTFSLTSDGSSLVIHYTSALVSPTLNSYGPWSGGSFPLVLSGPSGQTYKVLTNTNVALPLASWTLLTSGTFEADPAVYTDSAATNGTQFYRIVSP